MIGTRMAFNDFSKLTGTAYLDTGVRMHYYAGQGSNALALLHGFPRAGFDLYRAFEQGARDIRTAPDADGKLRMPVLGMYGMASLAHSKGAVEIGRELAENSTVIRAPRLPGTAVPGGVSVVGILGRRRHSGVPATATGLRAHGL
jgi:hypothetical protein